MTDRGYNVLFLCTGNSAGSILAESILQRDGADHFRAFSAGSQPKGTVNPLALKVLADDHYPATGFRSKSWAEFAQPDAPVMDFVFTVCDDAAGETCPVWPGHPVTAHWGIPDPAAVEGTGLQQEAAFVSAFRALRNLIGVFTALPIDRQHRLACAAKEAAGHGPGRPGGCGVTDIVIYHNHECGTSRNTLAMIRNAGIEPHVIEYLKTPPARALLMQLLAGAGMTVRAVLREKGTPYAALGLGNPALRR